VKGILKSGQQPSRMICFVKNLKAQRRGGAMIELLNQLNLQVLFSWAFTAKFFASS
jgi:hypothetical protein